MGMNEEINNQKQQQICKKEEQKSGFKDGSNRKRSNPNDHAKLSKNHSITRHNDFSYDDFGKDNYNYDFFNKVEQDFAFYKFASWGFSYVNYKDDLF
jgi:hypothetical protein